MIDDENTSSNEEQVTAENMELMNDFLNEINMQMATINPSLHPVDYINQFVTQYLNLPDQYDLEDNTIYIDEALSLESRRDMLLFVSELNRMAQSSFGIALAEPDMKLINNLYQVMVMHLIDNMVYYIAGLQNLDSDFDEDLPNYEETKFEYFKKTNPDVNGLSKYNQVSSYLDYILQNHIYPNLFFEFALFESSGNVDLSNLYTESINNRIMYDSEFFILKFQKIFSSDDTRDRLLSKLIDIIL